MPAIGWIFLALAFALVLGSLFMLRDTAHSLEISKEKLGKIKKRKAEVEAEEKAEEENK